MNDPKTESAQAELAMAIEHSDFKFECFDIHVMEAKELVWFERVWSASPWRRDRVERAKNRIGIDICYCDQCAFQCQMVENNGVKG